jgi:hypothetical protein
MVRIKTQQTLMWPQICPSMQNSSLLKDGFMSKATCHLCALTLSQAFSPSYCPSVPSKIMVGINSYLISKQEDLIHIWCSIFWCRAWHISIKEHCFFHQLKHHSHLQSKPWSISHIKTKEKEESTVKVKTTDYNDPFPFSPTPNPTKMAVTVTKHQQQ